MFPSGKSFHGKSVHTFIQLLYRTDISEIRAGERQTYWELVQPAKETSETALKAEAERKRTFKRAKSILLLLWLVTAQIHLAISSTDITLLTSALPFGLSASFFSNNAFQPVVLILLAVLHSVPGTMACAPMALPYLAKSCSKWR